jgi:hypothetical protein
MIRQSFMIASFTSLYYMPEIVANFSSFSSLVGATLVQILHDAICILFVIIIIDIFYRRSLKQLLYLNIMHCSAMGLFAYYKRCILTLLYNELLSLPMCSRYIPIWQRFLTAISNDCLADIETTYLWLNDHIIKCIIVGIANTLCLCHYKNLKF